MQEKWIKYRTIVLKLSLLFFIGVFAVWYFAQTKKYHFELPMLMGNHYTPLTKVEIEGKTYRMLIDTGSKFEAHLSYDLLTQIKDKKLNGSREWKDVKGNCYDSPSYVVSDFRMGGLTFSQLPIQEEVNSYEQNAYVGEGANPHQEERIFRAHGAIGRPLLKKHNMLLDFHKMKLVMSNRHDKLAEMGYSLSEMVKVPFEFGLLGLIVNVDTELGKMRLAIDTGSTINIIRNSFLKDVESIVDEYGLSFVTVNGEMVGQNMGEMAFHPFPLTPLLTDLDGVLGATFLDKHAVYFDFENNFVFIKR